MPELDTGRLIRHAQELITESKGICERSRHAVEKSKRLKQIIDVPTPRPERTRRKRSLKDIASPLFPFRECTDPEALTRSVTREDAKYRDKDRPGSSRLAFRPGP